MDCIFLQPAGCRDARPRPSSSAQLKGASSTPSAAAPAPSLSCNTAAEHASSLLACTLQPKPQDPHGAARQSTGTPLVFDSAMDVDEEAGVYKCECCVYVCSCVGECVYICHLVA